MKNRKGASVVKLFLIGCIIAQSLSSLFLQLVTGDTYHENVPQSMANFTQDNNLGEFQVDYNGNIVGLSSVSGTFVNTTSLVTNTNGYATTINIAPPSFAGWKELSLVNNGNIDIQILDCSNNPIPAQGSFPGGIISYTSTIDISSIDYISYPCLRVKTILSNAAAAVDNLKVTWDPLPIFQFNLIEAKSIPAGECANYYVRRSASYSNGADPSLYVTIPYASGCISTGIDNINCNYEQFPFSNIKISGISHGGYVTTGSFTHSNGQFVPENSIFWAPSTINLGSTHQYKFTVCTDAGTQNNLLLNFTAAIGGTGSALTVTDQGTTTITSTPRPEIVCGHDRSSAGYIISSSGATVNYTFTASNGGFTYQAGVEDIYNPLITLDFNQIIANLQSSCGVLNESDAKARITLPIGFTRNGNLAIKDTGSTPPLNNVLYAVNNNYYPKQLPLKFTGAYSVNYNGCTPASITMGMSVMIGGDGGVQANNSCPIDVKGPRTISGCNFWDSNQNGVYNSPSENALSGMIVNIYTNYPNYHTLVATVVTDSNGNRSTKLPDGIYYNERNIQNQMNLYSGYLSTGEYFTTTTNYPHNFTVNNADLSLSCDGNYKAISYYGEPGWYSKCQYTNTTNERVISSPYSNEDFWYNNTFINSLSILGHERSNRIQRPPYYRDRYIDADCNNQDYYGSPTTIIEQNYSGAKNYYYLDFTSNGRRNVRNNVYVIDRIPDQYDIVGGQIFQQLANSNYATATSNNAVFYYHNSIGTTPPSYDTGARDGITIPSSIGTGWSQTPMSGARWVIMYMRCMNINPISINGIDYQAAPAGSICYNTPINYQFQIQITPNITLAVPNQCDATTVFQSSIMRNTMTGFILKISQDNNNNTYLPRTGTSNYTTYQESKIISTDPFSRQIGSNNIKMTVVGNDQLCLSQTGVMTPDGTYTVLMNGDGTNPLLSGVFTIDLPTVRISTSTGGYNYCATAFNITGLQLGTGATVVQSGCILTVTVPHPLEGSGVVTGTYNNSSNTEGCEIVHEGSSTILNCSKEVTILDVSGGRFDQYDYILNNQRGICVPDVANGFCTYTIGGSRTINGQVSGNTQYASFSEGDGINRLYSGSYVKIGNNRTAYYSYQSPYYNYVQENTHTVVGNTTEEITIYNGVNNRRTTIVTGSSSVTTSYYNWNGSSWVISSYFVVNGNTTTYYDAAGNINSSRTVDTVGTTTTITSYDANGVVTNTHSYTVVGGTVNNTNDDYSLCIPFIRDGTCTITSSGSWMNGQDTCYQTTTTTNSRTSYNNTYDYYCEYVEYYYGQFAKLTFSLNYPAGFNNYVDAPVHGTFDAQYTCNTGRAISYQPTQLCFMPPEPGPARSVDLFNFKYNDRQIVDISGQINYLITAYNTGDTPTTNTFIIDKIPSGMKLIEAYTSGLFTNFSSGFGISGINSLTCPGCLVYFSDSTTLHDPLPNVSYTLSDVSSNFTIGSNNNGIWTPTLLNPITFIAFGIDNPVLHVLPLGQVISVGLKLENESNPVGSVIPNTTTVIGEVFGDDSGLPEVLQAIGNTVYTTIIPKPNTLGGTIYRDSNESSEFDTSEGVFSGVTVYLYNGPVVLATAITDANGSYIFTGLIDENYTITYNTSLGSTSGQSINIFSPYSSNTGMISGGSLLGIVSGATMLTNIIFNGGGGNDSINNNFGLIKATTCDPEIRKYVSNPISISGGSISYTLEYWNNGPIACENVIVSDTLPSNFIYQSHTTGSYVGNTIELALPLLGVGETGYIIIDGTVFGESGTVIDNMASITTDTPQINTGGEQATGRVTINTMIGGSINGFIYVDTGAIIGSLDGSDSILSGILVILTDSTGSMVVTTTNSLGYYEFPNLTSGAYTITYNNSTIYNPSVANTGNMGSSISGSSVIAIILSLGGVSSSNNFGLIPNSVEYNLWVTKSSNTSIVQVGGSIVWTIRYGNSSAHTGFDVQLIDNLPAELTVGVVDPSAVVNGQEVVWSLGTLPPYSSGSIQITTNVSTGVVGNMITNPIIIVSSGSTINGTTVIGLSINNANGESMNELGYSDNVYQSSVSLINPITPSGGPYIQIPLPEIKNPPIIINPPLEVTTIIKTLKKILTYNEDIEQEHTVAPTMLPATGAEG